MTRYHPGFSDMARLQQFLKYHEIDLILDVGANRGQYAQSIRWGGYEGNIVSFEPLKDAYSSLKKASCRDRKWAVAERMAIGERDSTTAINVAKNSLSSSILNICPNHLAAAPESRYIGSERVPLRRLDTVAPGYFPGHKRLFLKMDVQGYERQVLDGATGILGWLTGIQMELSFVTLYEGQPLFPDMLQVMRTLGFELHGIMPEFADCQTGRLLQADGVFCKTGGAPTELYGSSAAVPSI